LIFKKVGVKAIIKRLEKIAKEEEVEVDAKVLEQIAINSRGGIRDAETLLQQILSLGDKKISYEEAEIFFPRSDLNLIIDFIKNLTENNKEKVIFLINKLVDEGVDLKDFNSNLIEFLRKLMLLKIDKDIEKTDYDLSQIKDKEIIALSQKIDLKNLIEMINIFIQSRKELEYAEIPQLPLELAAVQICEMAGNK